MLQTERYPVVTESSCALSTGDFVAFGGPMPTSDPLMAHGLRLVGTNGKCWQKPLFRCQGRCGHIWPIRYQHLADGKRYCPPCRPAHAVRSSVLELAS